MYPAGCIILSVFVSKIRGGSVTVTGKMPESPASSYREQSKAPPHEGKVHGEGASSCINFFETVHSFLNTEVDLTVECKVDENYPRVSTASVLVKVKRDGKIEEVKGKYDKISSGYPLNS